MKTERLTSVKEYKQTLSQVMDTQETRLENFGNFHRIMFVCGCCRVLRVLGSIRCFHVSPTFSLLLGLFAQSFAGCGL